MDSVSALKQGVEELGRMRSWVRRDPAPPRTAGIGRRQRPRLIVQENTFTRARSPRDTRGRRELGQDMLVSPSRPSGRSEASLRSVETGRPRPQQLAESTGTVPGGGLPAAAQCPARRPLDHALSLQLGRAWRTTVQGHAVSLGTAAWWPEQSVARGQRLLAQVSSTSAAELVVRRPPQRQRGSCLGLMAAD